MVTALPKFPEVGERLVMLGANPTMKGAALLANPFTVTTTFPLVAPVGTGTVMLPLAQLVGEPATPLKVTVPGELPKFAPAMVIEVPTGATDGDRLLMLGAPPTLNAIPLLTWPLTVTITFPVVAVAGTTAVMMLSFQLVVAAVTPLKATVFGPCSNPKFEPLMVTAEPAGPIFGDKLVMVGASTVKRAPVLAVPFTVTTTFPVPAPNGTGTTMLVSLQLFGVASVPLKVTVLLPWEIPKLDPEMVTTVATRPDVGDKL